MKAEKEHIDELIVSYLSNELDGNAVHELKEWIAASVENEKYFMQRQEIWFSAISVKEDVKYDKSKAFEQFKNRIANQRLNDKRERENFCLSKFWRYAAVIVVLFSVSYFSYWRGGISIKEVFSDINCGGSSWFQNKIDLAGWDISVVECRIAYNIFTRIRSRE